LCPDFFGEADEVSTCFGGGEWRKGSFNCFLGYSVYAQLTSKPPYLEPNSESLQKPVEGVYPYWRFSQPKRFRL